MDYMYFHFRKEEEIPNWLDGLERIKIDSAIVIPIKQTEIIITNCKIG